LAAQNTAGVVTGAAQEAAAAGHAELAIQLLKAVVSQIEPAPAEAAAAVLANQSVATGVLDLWEAAECTIREEEARWPALQQLVIGIASTHQQLQSTTDIATQAAGRADVQATGQVVDDAASEAVVAVSANASGILCLGRNNSSSSSSTGRISNADNNVRD
jgi:hypothetical protein